MKKARIIWGAICAAVVLGISVAVCVQWREQGCEWFPSVVLAIAYYSACGAAAWLVVDEKLKGE